MLIVIVARGELKEGRSGASDIYIEDKDRCYGCLPNERKIPKEVAVIL